MMDDRDTHVDGKAIQPTTSATNPYQQPRIYRLSCTPHRIFEICEHRQTHEFIWNSGMLHDSIIHSSSFSPTIIHMCSPYHLKPSYPFANHGFTPCLGQEEQDTTSKPEATRTPVSFCFSVTQTVSCLTVAFFISPCFFFPWIFTQHSHF